MAQTNALNEPTTTADGWFVLNPHAPFKLHVAGVRVETVPRLQRALRKGIDLVREAEQPVLRILAKEDQFRCREIEAFQAQAAPVFEAAVQQVLHQSLEWTELRLKGDAAVNRRRRFLHAIEEQVIRVSGETFRYVPALVSQEPDVRRRTVTTLLCLSYAMAEHHGRHAARRDEFAASVRGWRFIKMPGGCCPTCKAIPEQLPATRRPSVPVHVACGCSVHPVLR